MNISKTGAWSVSSSGSTTPPYGADSLWSHDGTAFTWKFKPSKSGVYNLSMWWTWTSSRSSNIPVDIQHAGGTARVYINQNDPDNASTWNSLGEFNFSAGTTYNIKITAQPSPSSTCADAVKLTLITYIPPVVIIDNHDKNTAKSGAWSVSSSGTATPPYGVDSLWSHDGTTFTWKFKPSQSGAYNLSMWWTWTSSRSSNIPVDIQHAGGTTRVYIDQNESENASKWNSLGEFNFSAGTTYSIKITAQPSPSSTCADAVKLTGL